MTITMHFLGARGKAAEGDRAVGRGGRPTVKLNPNGVEGNRELKRGGTWENYSDVGSRIRRLNPEVKALLVILVWRAKCWNSGRSEYTACPFYRLSVQYICAAVHCWFNKSSLSSVLHRTTLSQLHSDDTDHGSWGTVRATLGQATLPGLT